MPKETPRSITNMAERIELWPVDRLQPYAKNARTHSDRQVDQIAASIRQFGFTNPILVDSADGIIAGHGRLMAAKRLGLATVPVIVLDHLTDAQRRAYILADNKLALNAGWDEELLKEELVDLGELNFDVELTGFEAAELSSLFLEKEEGDTDAEEEWQGMPEFNQGDETSFRKLVVHFECQSDLDEFCRLIGQQLNEKTKSIWHPKKKGEDLKSLSYE